jgi:perosamine synthetase
MTPLFKVSKPDLSFFEKLSDIENYAFATSCLKFEEKLQQFFQVEKVFVTNSYSSAWLSLIDALNLTRDDEIIATPMACLASTQPLARTKASLTWCDVNARTGVMSTEGLQEVISKKTKIVVVNLFCGYAPDLKPIYNVAKEYGALVILDLIEGLGSKYEHKYVGAEFCDVAVVSTEAVRILNSNQGGALFVNNVNLQHSISLCTDYGIDRSIFREPNGEINRQCDIKTVALGNKQNEVNAMFGLYHLPRFDTILQKYKTNAKYWGEVIENLDIGLQEVEIIQSSSPNYWVYGILALDVDEAIQWFRERGFYASRIHLRNDQYSIFKDSKRHLPGVDTFSSSFLAVPSGWWVSKEQIKSLT